MADTKGKLENKPGSFDDIVTWSVLCIAAASFVAAAVGYGLGLIDLAGYGKDVFLLSFGALLRSFQSLHNTVTKQ